MTHILQLVSIAILLGLCVFLFFRISSLQSRVFILEQEVSSSAPRIIARTVRVQTESSAAPTNQTKKKSPILEEIQSPEKQPKISPPAPEVQPLPAPEVNPEIQLEEKSPPAPEVNPEIQLEEKSDCLKDIESIINESEDQPILPVLDDKEQERVDDSLPESPASHEESDGIF